MADLETEINLQADESDVRADVERHDGALLSDGGDPSVYWATLVPRGTRADRYIVRIAWSVYPHAAPSVLFAEVGGALGFERRCGPVTANARGTTREARRSSMRRRSTLIALREGAWAHAVDGPGAEIGPHERERGRGMRTARR